MTNTEWIVLLVEVGVVAGVALLTLLGLHK